MNYGQFGYRYGGAGRFPVQQDGFIGQETTPPNNSHPTFTQMGDLPFHSTPVQPTPHNLSSARLAWQADNSQTPIPPIPELLPIFPAHRIHSVPSTPVSNTALDLTVCRQLSVPPCSEEPIDMTVSSKVVSDQGDTPLALTKKISRDQATVTDDTQNHPRHLNRKLQKSKKSTHDEAESNVSGFLKLSKASTQVSDTAAIDVSPRRVTRQSVRSGQAALTTSAVPHLSPASTMEAVEGLLMLPQQTTPDTTPTEFTPTAIRPLRIPRKALRPMRLQAERGAHNSAIFTTHSESSCRPSTVNSEENFTHSTNPATSSKVRPATKSPSDNIQSTGKLQQSDSGVSASAVHTSTTFSVVTPVASVTTLIEATTQNLEQSRSKKSHREQSCTVTRESFRQIEDRQESAVSKSSVTTGCLSGSVVDIDFMHSYAGSVLSDTGSMPSDTGCMLSDATSMPYYTVSMPTDNLCLPSETGSMSPDTDSMPTDTVCLPSEAGSMPSDTGSTSDACSMPTDADSMSANICLPSDTGSMPTDAGSVSSDAGSMPSDSGSMPADTGSVPNETGSMPTDTDCILSDSSSMPADTGSVPNETGSMPTDTDCILSDAGYMPVDTGSIPSHSGSMPADSGIMPSDSGSIPSDSGSIPSDSGSMPTDSGSMPSDTGCVAKPPIDLDRQIASLASLDLNQTKQLILSLYRHLESLERTQLAGDITDHQAKNNQPAESHDIEQHQHDTSHDLPVTQASSSHSESLCPQQELAIRTTEDANAPGVNSDTADAGPMPTNTGSVPTDAGVLPTDTGSMPTDADFLPTDAGSVPTDAGFLPDTGSMPTGAGSVPTDAGFMPDTGSMPTGTGSVPTDAGFMPDTGSMPTGTGSVPTDAGFMPDTGSMPTDAGSVPTDAGFMPDVGSMPTGIGSVPTETGSMPTDTGYMPTDTDSMPTDIDSMQTDTDSMPTDTDSMPNETGSMPTEVGSMPTGTDSVPIETGSMPTDTGSMPTCTDSVSTETGSVHIDAGSMPTEMNDNTEKEKSDVSVVELSVATSLANSDDDSQRADDVVSSIGDEASNANHVDEALPPGNDQSPVQVPYGVPPLEPMVMGLDGGLVEIPSGYFAVPFSTVGEFCPHHEQPVIIFVNSPHYLETMALANQHLAPFGSHALSTQTVDEVQPHLFHSQQVTAIEPHSHTSQQVSLVESHSHTCQQVAPVQPHLIMSQNASLLESHTCTSQQVLPLEEHSITTQQVSPVPDAHHSHQVSVLEPVILTSQQVTSVQPHVHVLTRGQVSIMEPQSIASHQVVPLEPSKVTSQLESHTPSDHQVVPVELAIITSQQGSLLEPQSMTNQPESPLEPAALISEQDIPLSGVDPSMADESGGWIFRSSYQSSLKLEAISPPSSVMSMNDVEDAEENASADVFESTEDAERNSSRPSVAVSTNEEEEWLRVEDAEDNANAEVFESIEELERTSICPSMEVTDEASGGLVESDSLAHEVERSTSLVVSTPLEYVADTVELGSELQAEVIHFGADDLTEVVANEEVETVDLDDDEESQESLSLRLSVSSEEDVTDFVAKPSDSFTKRNQFGGHDLAADRSHFEPFFTSFIQPNNARVESDSEESTDARGYDTEPVTKAVVSNKEMTENDDSFLSYSPETHKFRIQDTVQTPQNRVKDIARTRNSNDNLIELCAERLGTSIRVDPNLLPKDITSLFNCSVVIKMLKISELPSGERKKKEISTARNKKRGRPRSKNVTSIDDDKTDKTVCTSEASNTSQAERTLEQTFEKTRKGFRRRRGKSSAGEAATEAGVAEVQRMNVAQSFDKYDSIRELVGTGLMIGDSLKTVANDPVFEPMPAVHLNQEDDRGEQHNELSVDLNSKDDHAVVVQKLSEVNMNCTDNSRIEITKEPDDLADSFVTISLNSKHVAEPVNTSVGADSVHTEDTAVAASSISHPSCNIDTQENKKNSRTETDDRKVSKKICKISLSGLSKPPKLHRLSPYAAPKLSHKIQGDLDLHSTSTCPSAFTGVSLEDETPILDVNSRREATGEIRSIVEPQVKAHNEKEERNIFQIKIPLMVGNCRETVPAKPDQGEMPESVSHEISKTVLTLRSIFQEVTQLAENRERFIPTTSETNQSGESSLHKPGEMELSCGEKTAGVDSSQFKGLSDSVADGDLEGSDVGAVELRGQTEGTPVSESETSIETGEKLVSSCETVKSSEIMASSSETLVSAGEMLVSSDATVNSGETVASLSDTTVSSVAVLASSSETSVASLSETTVSSVAILASSSETSIASSSEMLVNSSEAVDSSCEMVVSSSEAPFASGRTTDNSGSTIASSGETKVTSEKPIITFKEPASGFGETVERSNNTDDDDDNDDFFSEPNEYPMEQDDTSDMTFDSKEKPIGRSSWEENSPDEQRGKRKMISTDPNAVCTKRPRLTELNRGQPCEFSQENETAFSGIDQNQPTFAHGKCTSPRRKAVLQISNEGRKTCEESINSCCIVFKEVGDGDKPLPSDLLRHGQIENPLDDNRFSRNGEDGCAESGLHHPDSQSGNRISNSLQPEPNCLWEFSDTVETGMASSPKITRYRNLIPQYENSHNHSPETFPKSVNTLSQPVSRRPKDSTSQQSSDGEDLAFTSSNVQLLESLNSTTDVVVRKLPINCPLIKCTAINVVSRAVSSSAPGVKHLQCLFCDRLAPTMKTITAHLEQCHADVVTFAISKVNPSKDFSICYFCRHCQFVTTDHVVIWIHFQAAHNILGILESCHESTVAEDSPGFSAELDLSLDSPVQWYRVFMCPECSGLTHDEAIMALHMTATHPCSLQSNGHFVKVIALLAPRNHSKHLTYRMLLMDDAYSMNRKNCYVCSICYFVIFDPRLALSHFLLLHSDMKLLLICKSGSCNERFVREKAFVEHYQQRHKPKTVPMHFNCSVTLLTKSSAERGVTEVIFTDDD